MFLLQDMCCGIEIALMKLQNTDAVLKFVLLILCIVSELINLICLYNLLVYSTGGCLEPC